MFAQFPLHPTAAKGRPELSTRLAEWWPAALIGILALMSGVPDGNAQTLLSLL
jgi:hypothetical protein